MIDQTGWMDTQLIGVIDGHISYSICLPTVWFKYKQKKRLKCVFEDITDIRPLNVKHYNADCDIQFQFQMS